jgi:hypothetical protein
MGAPEYLLPRQVRQLHAASELKSRPLHCHYADSIIGCEFTMPPHAVAAVTIKLKNILNGGMATCNITLVIQLKRRQKVQALNDDFPFFGLTGSIPTSLIAILENNYLLAA